MIAAAASEPEAGEQATFRVLWWLKYSEELKLKGIATLSNTKACHQAK